MKISVLLLALFLSFSTFSASITVEPFDLEFNMDTNAYELDFELEMACRYEKFVFSDSSQYSYTYKKVPLKITKKKISRNLSRVTVSNTSKRRLDLTGFYRSNKQCQTYLNFFVKDKIYSQGRTNSFDVPIRLGVFEHSRLADHKVFDFEKLEEVFQNKKVSFNYKYNGRRMYVRLAFDDISTTGMSTYLSTGASANPETKMPYLLKN
ncbi:hypothetical protein A9Q84_16935 [Halobacteriovorax marinus]|uniref:Secreted protein n=1 Tax=Halobacteriovorax marinus TaxID=97084 RepID=A0A1Y5F4K6_9BACT|nr:hypothetical protein A9Q84_16935 [Halobacteriovorax marinus]